MVIEHIGITVEKPVETAGWLVKNFGCRLVSSQSDAQHEVAFVADEAGTTLLELIRVPGVAPSCSLLPSTSQLHIAFLSDDPYAKLKELEKAGAALVEDNSGHNPGEILLLLRDPWGNVFQLVKRSPGVQLKKG